MSQTGIGVQARPAIGKIFPARISPARTPATQNRLNNIEVGFTFGRRESLVQGL